MVVLVDAVLDVLDEVLVDVEVLVGVEVPDCKKSNSVVLIFLIRP